MAHSAAGLIALQLSASRPSLRPLAWLAFSVTLRGHGHRVRPHAERLGARASDAHRTLWILAVSVLAGCAPARPPIVTPDTSTRRCRRQRREGCYDCLIDARERYRSLANGRSWPTVVRRLFEVELLIAMRERELGLDPSAALAAAAELARELPAAIPADRYLAAVESLPHERHGWPRSELGRLSQAARA